MLALAKGHPNALAILIARHRDWAVAEAHRILKERRVVAVDAEDVAQMAFLRLWQHPCQYRREAGFRTYLGTILDNLILNEIRRPQSQGSAGLDEIAGHAPSPEQAMEDAEQSLRLRSAVGSLPARQGEAIKLKLQDCSNEDIGAAVDTTNKGAKRLIEKAIVALRATLGGSVRRPPRKKN